MKPKITLMTDEHILNHQESMSDSGNTLTKETLLLMEKLEKDFEVTIITSMKEDIHEKAGSTTVIHVCDRQDTHVIQAAKTAMVQSDACIIVDALPTVQPLCDILLEIPAKSILIHCYYSDGVNKLPKGGHVCRAFRYSSYAPLHEGLKYAGEYLKRFGCR